MWNARIWKYLPVLAVFKLKSKQSINSDENQVPSWESDNSTIDFVLWFWSESVRSFANKTQIQSKIKFPFIFMLTMFLEWWRWVMGAREQLVMFVMCSGRVLLIIIFCRKNTDFSSPTLCNDNDNIYIW